ncbi:MAG: molybdopterin-dependent oxidoreductase, partial [Novosphingobium sp.]
CMVQCGVVVDVADNKVLRIKGDFSHPLTRGYTCPKGRAMGQVLHHPDAIDRPLMRKDGVLVPVSWDEALDDVAAKLRQTIDRYGPGSVGMYFGSGLGVDSAGYAMEDVFYAALGAPPKFTPLTNDGTAKAMLAGAMTGSFALGPRTDYGAVELLVYIGTNPMVSHAHNTGMFNPGIKIKEVAARGEVWTIDPVLTETARMSTRHIAPHPGKDYAILAWIVRELVDHGPLTPKQPVQGLDRLRESLDGFDRARAAAIAGVSEQECQDLLDAIRRRGRCAIESGTGITMSASANLTQFFAWTIMVLTGSMNETGGAWFHPGVIHQFENFELPIMDSPFTPGPPTRPDVQGIMGEWPCAVLPNEIDAGTIRAFFNFGGHIVRSFPDTNALTAALAKLDLHVNMDIVHNESVALATHVLPPKYGLERAEFTRWDTLHWNANVQYSPALVAPRGERRSAWWILSQFMRRAGLPVPSHVPLDDREPGADEFMLSKLMEYGRCSFAEVQEKRYVEFPIDFPAAWVERHFERLGGWRLAVPEIIAQWERMRAADEAELGRFQAGQPRQLVYSPRRQRRKLNGQLDFLGEPAEILLHPATAAERGIADGTMVRIFNKAGEIAMVARFDPTILPGIVSIPHGHRDANVNFLTSTQDIDPLGGMALYSGVPIEIAPA